MHGGNQFLASALPQVGEADGDDEKGFEPFPERDDKRLKHVSVRPAAKRESISR